MKRILAINDARVVLDINLRRFSSIIVDHKAYTSLIDIRLLYLLLMG